MILKVMFVNLFVNLFLSILKLITGILGNSKTLVADAIHSLSDLFNNLICLVFSFFAKVPEDKKHPFGHGRYEYIASMFMSVMIIFLSIMIFYNALTSKVKIPSKYVLIIIIFTFIIKLILSKYTLKKSKELNSSILLSTGTESKYDAINSLLALIFVFISEFSKYIDFLKYGDKIGSIFIGIIILRIGIKFLRENISSLVGEVSFDKKYISFIKRKLYNFNEIKNFSDIKLIKYGTYYNVFINIYLDKNINLKEIYFLEKKIILEIKEKEIFKYINISFIPY